MTHRAIHIYIRDGLISTQDLFVSITVIFQKIQKEERIF